jgi:hypothetical protein
MENSERGKNRKGFRSIYWMFNQMEKLVSINIRNLLFFDIIK